MGNTPFIGPMAILLGGVSISEETEWSKCFREDSGDHGALLGFS
jgi:hypothetical protein